MSGRSPEVHPGLKLFLDEYGAATDVELIEVEKPDVPGLPALQSRLVLDEERLLGAIRTIGENLDVYVPSEVREIGAQLLGKIYTESKLMGNAHGVTANATVIAVLDTLFAVTSGDIETSVSDMLVAGMLAKEHVVAPDRLIAEVLRDSRGKIFTITPKENFYFPHKYAGFVRAAELRELEVDDRRFAAFCRQITSIAREELCEAGVALADASAEYFFRQVSELLGGCTDIPQDDKEVVYRMREKARLAGC